ncbi:MULTISPECIES: radical SAM/SPASM domain-containing protein [unclassified Desulfovibrio]|uniref:radical SAM/SPASM domain-containing protein n=1 Tax=unclassified Desulfovibrio TaxID=2593640 RepID=UPI000F5F547C|nr:MULTISPECIES: radical SAM/SPASM domain-containing protein [unclassified Desulfovibrio]RRD71725.1 radical SAM protein [Desulfovibrio sp. OH1209_COT-279]RRD87938.1 radical SAM protein [Desulfovibrio sp. OH1186_COT-070]
MEFMDISRCGVKQKAGVVPDFRQLRQLPKVEVSMDLEFIDTAENKRRLNETLAQGSAVVNISKINLHAKKDCLDEFPRRILFEMTSVCNVLCKMCPRNHLLRPAMHMPKKDYIRILKEIGEVGVEGLWLYHLGESLMHPDFREIVNAVSRIGNFGYVWMSTNGHLMNESNCHFILDSCIDYINYSMHGVSEVTHKSVIPQGNFAKVMANFETLIELKKKSSKRLPYIHLQMIEQETTKHEVKPFIKKFFPKVDVVSINMLEYVNLPENSFGYAQRERRPRGHCKRIQGRDCFICSNGAVTLCDAAYNCEKKYVGPLYLGNIHENSLYDIWNGDRRKKLLDIEREGLLTSIPLCSTCTDYDF